ncbi:MAG: alpha/beta hydrolase [Acidimicrobiales bacterium]
MSDLPELPGVRHEFVDAGGLRVHVALAGPDGAPAVMLVHGWPQSWWAWRHVIPAIAGRFRVIAPDLRGHGWSEAPAAGYEKEQLATDLLAVLDALGTEQVTWVGHDWGGWSGFLAALRAPERIDRMLALCIPHPWSRPDPAQMALFLGYQGPLSLPMIGPLVTGPMVRMILQSGRGADRLTHSDLALFSEHIPAHVSVALYRTNLTRELLPVIRGRYTRAVLEVPTTLLLGARDLVSRGTPAGLVDGQPQLQVELVENVAHWLPEQRPDAIVDWLDRR